MINNSPQVNILSLYWDPASNVEDIKRYIKGGFHPIRLGDVISSHGASDNESVPTPDSPPQRYRILHKLGRGEFATVWFAQALHERSWVPICCSSTLHLPSCLPQPAICRIEDMHCRWRSGARTIYLCQTLRRRINTQCSKAAQHLFFRGTKWCTHRSRIRCAREPAQFHSPGWRIQVYKTAMPPDHMWDRCTPSSWDSAWRQVLPPNIWCGGG